MIFHAHSPRIAVRAAAGALVLAALTAAPALGAAQHHSPDRRGPAVAPAPLTPPSVGAGLFGPASAFNAAPGRDAAVDPASVAMSSALRTEVQLEERRGIGPWIATKGCAPRIYTVAANQPAVTVALDQATATWRQSLQRAFDRVPMPLDAQPAPCADASLVVRQPSTDRYWDFFHLRRTADGWHAAWGGAMDNESLNTGSFGTGSWAGGQANWGSTATSIPLAAGTVRVAELRAGVIPHALALVLPEARAAVFVSPAQRTDGRSTDPNSIPEGARLRLDPSLDLDRLGLPPVTLALARAAQQYGMLVRDTTHHAIKFDFEDPAALRIADPYPALFAGRTPNYIAAKFPWGHLQVLDMHLSPGP